MKKFPCTKCGLCCMRAGTVENFPYKTDYNGVCEKYDLQKRECTIYEDRPIVCRIDDYYDKYLSANMDRNHWHHYNAQMCNKMINQVGLDKKFLVEANTGDLSDPKHK